VAKIFINDYIFSPVSRFRAAHRNSTMAHGTEFLCAVFLGIEELVRLLLDPMGSEELQ